MAVMTFDEYGEVRTEVLVQGQPLEEFEDSTQEKEPATVVKYIEAASGSSFSVRVSFSPPCPKLELHARLYIDGHRIDGICFRVPFFASRSPRYEFSRVTYEEGDNTLSKDFRFSELNIDLEDAIGSSTLTKRALDCLGEIELRIRKVCWIECHNKHCSKSSKPAPPKVGTEENGPIPEKCLKGRALSHRLSLGEARLVTKKKPSQQAKARHQSDEAHSHWSYTSEPPFAIFKFRYRSKDALRAEYIIPRTPSPVPLEDRDPDDLSLEEARELIRRQREINSIAGHIKQENIKRSGSPSFSERPTKAKDQAVSGKRRKCHLPVHVDQNGKETIDLT